MDGHLQAPSTLPGKWRPVLIELEASLVPEPQEPPCLVLPGIEPRFIGFPVQKPSRYSGCAVRLLTASLHRK